MKTLSLVIPVYNAPDLALKAWTRVPGFAACAAACGFKLVETIFVDDGSWPPLAPPPESLECRCRVIRQPANRGKGAAVRLGALSAAGEWVLMSDVDLSAPLSEFARLAPHADAWMACGSRCGCRNGMPLRRRVLSRLFHFAVWLLGVRGVQDTQCGFKLFRMDKMRAVFERQKIERFAFDVELIKRVLLSGGTVVEVPVAWHGGHRSSLRVLRDAPRMLLDVMTICCSAS